MKDLKIAIFIPAYNAAYTLPVVLDLIPESIKEKVQKIFTQLVRAVTYVHNSQCVHRDLKLENILLDKNENVKLCDFGFTREYEGKASYLQTFCGTICYSAPEMLKGEKYAGRKLTSGA